MTYSLCRLAAPVPPVANFRVMEEGLFSLRLAWTSPLGHVDSYQIFIPRSERQPFTPRIIAHAVKTAQVSFQMNVRYRGIMIRMKEMGSNHLSVLLFSQQTDPGWSMSRRCREMPPLMWLIAWRRIRRTQLASTPFTPRDPVSLHLSSGEHVWIYFCLEFLPVYA